MDDIKGQRNEETPRGIKKEFGEKLTNSMHHNKRKHTKSWFKRKLGRKFTGIIALLTLVYAIATILQWRAMEDSVANADSTLAFAKRTFNFSKGIAQTQIKYSKISTRAYIVFADSFKYKWPTIRDKIPKARIEYRNSGLTPALHVYPIKKYVITSNASWKVFHNLKPDTNTSNLFTITLGANQTNTFMTTSQFSKITSADSLAMSKGKLLVWYFKITYKDIFGVKHFTEAIGIPNPFTNRHYGFIVQTNSD